MATSFASCEILKKPVEVVKGRNLAGWAQKSSEPWTILSNSQHDWGGEPIWPLNEHETLLFDNEWDIHTSSKNYEDTLVATKVHMILRSFMVLTWMRDTIELV